MQITHGNFEKLSNALHSRPWMNTITLSFRRKQEKPSAPPEGTELRDVTDDNERYVYAGGDDSIAAADSGKPI